MTTGQASASTQIFMVMAVSRRPLKGTGPPAKNAMGKARSQAGP